MHILPSLFIGHGAPDLILGNSDAKLFLERLSFELPAKPAAIVVVSAHWETREPSISAPERNETIHDFGGFQRSLYDLRYPALGAPGVAARAATLGRAAGMPIAIDRWRGLDHGAWTPLKLAWPDADIPVIQLSVQPQAGVMHHLHLGSVIGALRREGVLIVGSGSLTHDLHGFFKRHSAPAAAEPDWVASFADWMHDRIAANDRDALLDYRKNAPHALRNHPTEEHLLPIFVAMGAAGAGSVARRLHRSVSHGVLRMDAYAFD